MLKYLSVLKCKHEIFSWNSWEIRSRNPSGERSIFVLSFVVLMEYIGKDALTAIEMKHLNFNFNRYFI